MRVFPIAILIVIFSLCAVPDQAAPNKAFAEFESGFLNELWKTYPTWATSVGYHNYDTMLPAPDFACRSKESAFSVKMLAKLHAFNVADLADSDKTDFYIMENQLQYFKCAIDTLKEYQWNPSIYNVCGMFADILVNDYQPIENRLRSFNIKMQKVEAYYEAAKKNIVSPTAEHTRLAIEQNTGGLSVFKQDLDDALMKSGLSETEKQSIRKNGDRTITIIQKYITWLKQLDNKSPRTFRLGEELYDRKFSFELQSKFTAQEIYRRAMLQKLVVTKKMVGITTTLWPKYFKAAMPQNKLNAVRMLIDTLSAKHVTADAFQQTIEQLLPRLTAFVKKKGLLYIDPSKPLVVRKEPNYMAGVAGASINAPGPYEKMGNTYYNVGSFNGWENDRIESYLREYNDYILQILNIHEAVPGHYTQLVYANKSKSLVKSILGSNTMIEGWAVYAERMMLESGYDIDSTRTSDEASPEMWLMYYKWHLRSICNTILDYSVHARNMKYDNAMHLLVDEAFQEKTEALNKWKRVTVTQTQLSCYYTGFTEIYDFREEYKGMSKGFNLKSFHEGFLSYGSAPVKYIRQMMMEKIAK